MSEHLQQESFPECIPGWNTIRGLRKKMKGMLTKKPEEKPIYDAEISTKDELIRVVRGGYAVNLYALSGHMRDEARRLASAGLLDLRDDMENLRILVEEAPSPSFWYPFTGK